MQVEIRLHQLLIKNQRECSCRSILWSIGNRAHSSRRIRFRKLSRFRSVKNSKNSKRKNLLKMLAPIRRKLPILKILWHVEKFLERIVKVSIFWCSEFSVKKLKIVPRISIKTIPPPLFPVSNNDYNSLNANQWKISRIHGNHLCIEIEMGGRGQGAYLCIRKVGT